MEVDVPVSRTNKLHSFVAFRTTANKNLFPKPIIELANVHVLSIVVDFNHRFFAVKKSVKKYTEKYCVWQKAYSGS